mmetsp:Transcript_19935/g.56346  ORF Transcript_19935/g.56346 Transcript_19935/m.56346 type:complete len:265 (-) Transcript_19935:110-904(-)
MALARAQSLLEKFQGQVTGGDAGAKDTLVELKVLMTEFASLPPVCGLSDHTRDELTVARSVLEHAVLLSLRDGDAKGFERHMAQVSVYYTDFGETLPDSDLRFVVTGLGLLHLLVENRLGEFHSELELLSMEQRADPHVAFVVALEEMLMEGSFNRVLARRDAVPSPYYAHFMDQFVHTVRAEIAECSAASYPSLSLEAAQKMLMFGSRQALEDYITETGAAKGWVLSGDRVVFTGHEKPPPEVPSMELITNTLAYATELERIV